MSKNEKRTILFFDDQRLNLRFNVTRKIGKPVLIQDSKYQDTKANTSWAYPCVFKDESSGKWRMLYQGCLSNRDRVPLIAESEDGLRWRPIDTRSMIELDVRKLPNQVLWTKGFSEWPACYIDDFADVSERIKGLVVTHKSKYILGSELWVSPDGLKWTKKEGVKWQNKAPDPGVNVFWNNIRQSYVFTTRPDWTDRRIAIFETKDWKNFSDPELVIQADALDTPLAEPYGMPVFPYEGYYIGLLWIYHTAPQVEEHCPHKFYDGHVDCQLAYSLNGLHFQRCLREPFIENGTPEKPDSGCLYPSSFVVKDDGSILIYASVTTKEHGYDDCGTGSIVAYKLRQDGFVFLESTGGKGIIGTRSLFWKGGEVEINIQSQNGYSRVQLTDEDGIPINGYTFEDCLPFTGDDTSWSPMWKNGKMLDEHRSKTLRLEIELKNARIYSIKGDFIPLVAGESWRFNKEGITPQYREGF